MSSRQRNSEQTRTRAIGLLLLLVGCLRSGQPVVPPPPMDRPTDAAQVSLLHADAVKRALVHIEARCTHDRVSGTGFIVDVSRYGLTRDALVMTAWHVIQPPGCSGQKVDVTLSGPGVGELTLSDVLGSHLVFPKEDPRKLGLDVAILQVNAKEGATALPLDELPLTAGRDLVTIWGYPISHGQAHGPDAEVTYRKGPVVPGPTQDGHATLTTDALLRTDQGMSGGPVVLQGHGSVVALVNRRDLLPSGTAELPYVLTPMSVVRDLLPAHLRQRLHLLPRQAEDFALPALPTAYVHRPQQEAAVKQALTTRSSGPGVQKAPFVVVHGMPGVGKSTLAKAVAQQLAADLRWQVLYRDVAQRTPDGFVVELLQALTGERPRLSAKPSMGIALAGAPERGITMEDLAAQLHAELRNRPRLLLFLDDVTWTQLPAWLLRAVEDTPVLLTSRQSFPEGATISLDVLTDIQCQELYQRLRSESKASVSPQVVTTVCTQLGHHPTALTLAAGVLKRKRGTWTDADLLTHLSQKRLDVLEQGTSDPTRTIPALCEESLRTLPDSQRAAATLAVVVLGQLADAAVPRALLTAILSRPSLLGGRADTADAVESAIDQVVEAGLVSPDGPSEQKLLRMHTLAWEWASKLARKAAHAAVPQKVRDELLAVLKDRQASQTLSDALLTHLLKAQEEAAKAKLWPRVIEYGTMFQEEMLLYGHWSYLKQLLQNSLSATESSHDLAAKGKLKKALGVVAHSQGDSAAARKFYHDSLDLAQAMGDRKLIASNLGNLGNLAQSQGDYETARKFYRQALDLAQAMRDRKLIAGILLNLGVVAQSQGDYETARKFHQQSLHLAQAMRDRKLIASNLLSLGEVARMQGHYAEARKFYHDSLDLAQAMGDRQSIANILNRLGVIAQLHGDYGAAHKYHQDSLDLAQAMGDRQSIANNLLSLGSMAQSHGDYAEARKFYQESLDLAQAMGSRQLIAHNLGSLGIVADLQGDYSTARKFYRQSLELAQAMGDREVTASILLNLGTVAQSQGDYSMARKLHQKSLGLAQALGDRRLIARNLTNLGIMAKLQGDYEAARKFYQQSLDLAQALGDRRVIAGNLTNLGSMAGSQGDYEAARKFYQQSLDLAQALGDRELIAKVLRGQSAVAARTGRKSEARQLLDQAIQILRALRDPALDEAQKERDALGPPPDPTKCRTTCQDLQAKGELRTSIDECVKVLCAD